MRWAIFLYLFFGGQNPDAIKVVQLEETFASETACQAAMEDTIRAFVLKPTGNTIAGGRINFFNIEQSICRPVGFK